MLSQVLAIVHGQGWFDTQAGHEKSIFLSQGASLWMVLSRAGVPQTFVKFSELVSLAEEAQRCKQASSAYPTLAPKFLGHVRHGELEVLVTSAVEFLPVTTGMTQARRAGQQIHEGLALYFKAMAAAARPPQAAGSRVALQDGLVSYFAGSALHRPAVEAFKRLASQIQALPQMPQHGDLVMNNLGLKPTGRLVIFDWEDFGAIDVPGLDLFTLEVSFAVEAGLRPGVAAAWPPAPRALDTTGCCAALGIAPTLYAQLRPVYALLFRYLKRNYGPEVQSRLDHLISDLAPH